MLLFLLGCVKSAPVEPTPQAEPGHLTILHTNDMHGHYLPEPAEWLADASGKRPEIGGFDRLDAEVQITRAQRLGATLLLDGGDILTGTPLTDLVVKGAKGGAMLEFMEAIGYNAWALGNHEFDKGLANLQVLTQATTLPVLSANVRKTDGSMLLPNQEPSKVFVVNGIKIAVIGATTMGLGGLMSKGDFAQVQLQEVEVAVQAEIARLDPVSDLVVVLSHIGLEDDRELAKKVGGIDLIVGGHSHTRMPVAETVEFNGHTTRIVQAGSYTRSLGVVDLVVSNDQIESFNYVLRDLTPETSPGPAQATVHALTVKYQAEIEKVYGEIISTSPAIMGRSYNHESPVGRWITEVLRETAKSDVAFYNGGGLRADLPAGDIRVLDIYQCFPFGNQVVRFKLLGSELMSIVTANMAADAFEKRGFLSMSGLSYTWRLKDGAPEAVAVKVGDQPLDPAKTYTVASNSYVVEQWEKNLGVQPREPEPLGMSDFEAAVAWARNHPVADPGSPRAVRLP